METYSGSRRHIDQFGWLEMGQERGRESGGSFSINIQTNHANFDNLHGRRKD